MMTVEELITEVKTLVGEDADEAAIKILLVDAENIILDFCHVEELPERLVTLKRTIAVKLYNRMGQEGSASYSEGGKSQSFESVLTESDKRLLYRYRRMS